MPRPLLMLFSGLLITASALALLSCKADPEPAAAVRPGSSEDIVVLADGATMVARQGSRDRAMADWLAAARSGGRSFALRSDMFIADGEQLSETGLGDAATLATMLRATPDAWITIVSAPGSGDLGARRAAVLAAFIEGRDIPKDRIELRAANDNMHAEDEAGLRLIAQRGAIRKPIETAAL